MLSLSPLLICWVIPAEGQSVQRVAMCEAFGKGEKLAEESEV